MAGIFKNFPPSSQNINKKCVINILDIMMTRKKMFHYRMKWIPDPPGKTKNIILGEINPPAFGCLLKTCCRSNAIG